MSDEPPTVAEIEEVVEEIGNAVGLELDAEALEEIAKTAQVKMLDIRELAALDHELDQRSQNGG